jgi:hypothetical protein
MARLFVELLGIDDLFVATSILVGLENWRKRSATLWIWIQKG